MLYNYHTHTHRCRHAAGTEEEYVQHAIAGGYRILGFADHTPMPFPTDYRSTYRMDLSETEDYVQKILALKEQYKNRIALYWGVEAEYYPAVFPALMQHLAPYSPDYMILGQHFIHNEYDDHIYAGMPTDDPTLLKTYVDQVIRGLQTGCFTYLAHPDLPNFTGDDALYRQQMLTLCEACKALSVPLEINLLGLKERRQYPSERFFRLAAEVGNDIVIGVDAHAPERLSEHCVSDEAFAWAKGLNLRLLEEVMLRKPVFSEKR